VAGLIPGVAATQHLILPAAKLALSFFLHISAAIGGLSFASLRMPENLYPVFRGTEMRPNHVGLPENFLFPEGASKPDLDALKTAKARQDASYQKLDTWIAAAIAELSDEKRSARQQQPVGRASATGPRKARAR
jgi:hypothetical protein